MTRLLWLGGLAAAIVAASAVSAAERDPAALDRGSDLAYRRALAPAATERLLNADSRMALRGRRIVNRFLGAAAAIEPAAQTYPWRLDVVPGTAPDVHVYPGGRLIVSHGLFASLRSDDEVAALIAYALAHSLLGHDTARIVTRIGTRTPSADPNRQALEIADAVTEVVRAPRYTTAEIAAADRAAVELLARAGFDPRAAAVVWQRLAGSNEGLVRRSPIVEGRLDVLDALGESAIPLYNESRAKAAAAQPRPPVPVISGPQAPSPPR